MGIGISVEDVDKVVHLLVVLHDWSGVSDETPDDTEVIEYNGNMVTLGDIRDAFTVLQKCREAMSAK